MEVTVLDSFNQLASFNRLDFAEVCCRSDSALSNEIIASARRAQRCPWGDTGQRAPLRFTTMPTM
jgi:hypothetical protein